MIDMKLFTKIVEDAKKIGPGFEQAIFKELGKQLSKLRKGPAITVREANELKAGDIVWMTYRKEGYSDLRINEATLIDSISSPGSLDCICGGFTYNPEKDLDSPVSDWNHGEAYLYQAIPKVKK